MPPYATLHLCMAPGDISHKHVGDCKTLWCKPCGNAYQQANPAAVHGPGRQVLTCHVQPALHQAAKFGFSSHVTMPHLGPPGGALSSPDGSAWSSQRMLSFWRLLSSG